MILYNDLMIIELIVPSLTKEALTAVLTEIKKVEKVLEVRDKDISLEGIIRALSLSPNDDPLLNDFLQCNFTHHTVSVGNL